VALSRDIVIRLLGDADSAIKAQKAAADAAEVTVQKYRQAEREYDKQQRAIESASRKQRKAMEDVGRASVVAGAAIVAGLGFAIKAAVDWESAWTGVLKTVSGTPAQLAKLEQGLRGLARVLPATHEEIAAVAEAAGQLGVQTENIVEFTRVMINLGETTNLSADEAATSLAQLMNVMQTAPDDVDRLGSALVALGNAGASTEADIVKMASYLTGSARLIGASESDVLALANAMTSMGINAERGGGVMTRVMQDIYAAVQEGGDQLQGFADVAGVTAEEFARQFQADPIAAIDAFVQGLNDVEASGGNVVSALGDLGYVGTQDTAVLLQLKGAGDLLTDSLELGNEAWEQNTALVQEAAKRYDTTAAKTEMARNALNDAAIEIGDVFLPVMASLAESVADVAGWFADLPDPVKAVLGGLGGVAGVAALAGGAFLLLAPRVMETFKAFKALQETSPGVASGLGKIGKAAGIAGVIVAVGEAVKGLVDSLGPAAPTMEETTDALLGMSTSMEAVNEMFTVNSGDFLTRDINGLADAAARLTQAGFGDRVDDFLGSLTFWDDSQGGEQRTQLIEQINQLGDSLALMVNSGNADLAARQFDTLLTEWERGGGTQQELLDLMPAYAEALGSVDNEQQAATESARLQAEQAAMLAENTDFVYGSLQGYAQALGMSEEATQELIDKSNELGQSLGDFVDPLDAYTSLMDEKTAADQEAARATAEATDSQKDSWEDYVHDVDVTLDEYLARLEEQVADQAAWQENMLILAGQVSQGTLDELARMGPEGAPLVADLVNASDAELDRFDEVTALRSKEATDAWGAQLTLAQPVLAAIARTAGQDVVDGLAEQLANGTTTVAAIARQYGIELAAGSTRS
jgi:TP901 family phage tail tape measure protein